MCDATHPARLVLSPGAGRDRSSHSPRFVSVYDDPCRSQLTHMYALHTLRPAPLPYSDSSQPAEVQNTIKAIFEERTKFV